MGVRTRREGGDFLVPDMDPFDLALTTNRVRQPVKAVAYDAVDPIDSRRDEDFRKLLRYCFGHAVS